MSKFKLIYFPVEGRAGPIRNLCAIGKVRFVDQIVRYEDWPKIKHTIPYGQLPIIQVGDLTINQSGDILRYASKLAGLYPKHPLEALQVDSLVTNMIQIYDDTAIKSMFSRLDQDTLKKMAAEYLDKKEGKLGRFLENMDSQIGVGTSGYLFEFGLTGADLQLYEAICRLSSNTIPGISKTYIRDNFENLEAYRVKVASIEEIDARFKDEKHPLHNSVWTKNYKYD